MRIQHPKALADVLILLSCEDSIPLRPPAAPHDHTCTRKAAPRSQQQGLNRLAIGVLRFAPLLAIEHSAPLSPRGWPEPRARVDRPSRSQTPFSPHRTHRGGQAEGYYSPHTDQSTSTGTGSRGLTCVAGVKGPRPNTRRSPYGVLDRFRTGASAVTAPHADYLRYEHHSWRRWSESNAHSALRTRQLCPLSYSGSCSSLPRPVSGRAPSRSGPPPANRTL